MLICLAFVSAESTNCTDSDGGKNYNIKGTTIGTGGTRTDDCFNRKTGVVSSCYGCSLLISCVWLIYV